VCPKKGSEAFEGSGEGLFNMEKRRLRENLITLQQLPERRLKQGGS